jgi:hypothetical protein
MSTKQIHIFISHSWANSGHYDTLSAWIFDEKWSSGQASLDFRNYSVPKDDPIHDADNDAQLKQAIYAQVAYSHVLVIPTGMYANYSKWIQKEIDAAKHYGKPILAVSPWAQERESSVVKDNADEAVGWNKQPVIDAIWRLYNK